MATESITAVSFSNVSVISEAASFGRGVNTPATFPCNHSRGARVSKHGRFWATTGASSMQRKILAPGAPAARAAAMTTSAMAAHLGGGGGGGGHGMGGGGGHAMSMGGGHPMSMGGGGGARMGTFAAAPHG